MQNSIAKFNSDTNEGFKDVSTTPHPLVTTKWGLLKGELYSRENVIIEEVEGRGRSAYAAKAFKAGEFLCEYRGVVFRKQGEDWGCLPGSWMPLFGCDI